MGVAGYVYTLSLSKITKACVEHVHDSLPSTVQLSSCLNWLLFDCFISVVFETLMFNPTFFICKLFRLMDNPWSQGVQNQIAIAMSQNLAR